MKIAVNTRMLLSGKMEGIGRFTYEIFSRMAKNHPEVEFHFFFDRPYDSKFVFAENVIPHFIGPPARHPYLMRIWYDITWPLLLKKINPDIVISPDAQCSLTTKFPQIVVIHDINFEHYPKDIPPVYYRDLKKRTPKFCAKAEKIITVSEFSKKDLMAHYKLGEEKMDVIYNGASEFYSPLNDEEKVKAKKKFAHGEDYFIYVGSIHPRKNLQRLIPAFLSFKKRTQSPTKLVVVGQTFWKNKELDGIMKEAVENGDIIFVGRLEGEDLKLAVGGAKASVYVSYFEGFGIPIVEAFSARVPVITSNVTSMPEVAGNAALLIDPFSVDSISKGLEKIDNDEALRAQLINQGSIELKRFSWEQSSQKFWRIIEETIRNAKS